jgi:acyl transferase domain-containing protein/acyl carrier protein
MVRTAAVGRHHHDLRRVVTGSGADDLVAGLAAPLPGPAAGGRRAPRVALLFTGQGSQYVGMGRGLHRAHPVFRAELDACREVLSDLMGRDLYEVMWAGTDADLARTSLTQPSLVAVELALAALWQSWGVDPVVALGHSIGEVTAAIHAGVLSREDGLTLVHHRARLMQSAEPGAMLAVAADPGRVTELLTAGGLDLAAVNGPKAVVVAGPDEEVSAFAAVLTREGVRSRRLAVSHAFHSRMMDPVLGELRTVAARFSHAEAAFPLVSNVTGDTAPAGRYGPDYWPAQVRGTVRFADGLRRLVEHEVDTVLEVGPGGTLAALALAADVVERERALTSLRRGADEPTTALDAAARLYGIGQGLDWRAVHAGTRGSADVPRYPFARTTHWTPAPARAAAAAAAKVAGAARSPGPHWGVPLRSPGLSGRVFTALRSQTFPAYLTDHRLYGTVVTPAASHLATVLSAVAATGGAPPTLTDIVCPRALVVEGSAEHELHVVLGDDRLRVASLLDAGAGTWQDHVTARLGDAVTPAPWPGHDRADFAVTAERHLTGERFYACFRDLGYTLGPSFRWITDLWIGDCECLVRLAPPELPDRREDYVLHPGLIDSCFQSIAGFLVDDGAREAPSLAIPFSVAAFVPREVGRVPQADELYAWVRVRAAENLPNGRQRVAAADIRLELSDGTAVLDVTDLRVRHASRDTLTSATGSGAPHRFRVEWVEHPAPAPAPAATADAAPLTVELISVDGAGDDLGTALATAGHAVARTRPETLAPAAGRVDVVLDVVSGSTAEGEAGGALAVRDAVARLASRLRSRAVGATYAVVVEGGATVAPLREAVWGMLASLEAEDPARRLLRVESAATAAPGAVAEAVVDAVRRGVPEPRLRVSGSAVSVARLSRAAPEPAVPVLSGGVLVTGGTGALGLSTAAWAVRRGAASVTLMSRGGEHAGVLDTEGPAPLCVVRGDVTDLADCRRALAAARRTAPVGHVFHLAGSTADGEFGSLDDADFAAAFAAKALGADVLLTALSEGADPLPSVVLYSSVASCLGSPGQTAYAAANGYLTGLAERLRTSGAPVTSVLWGPWVPVAGTGLAATAAAGAAVERAGVRVLDDDAAHAALDAVARSAAAATVVVDLAGYPARVRGTRRAALVAGLAVDTAGADAGSGPGVGAVPGAAPGHGPAPGPPAGWLALRVAGSDAGRRRAIVTEAVAGVVSDVLGRPVPPGETRGLMDLGLDSIMSIDVRARLSHALGVTLPATIAFDHPTLAALSAELERAWLPGPAPLPAGGGAGRGERSDDDLADLLAAVEADLSAEV